MLELTEQQQGEIEKAGWPPRVVNPKTQETFVLLHVEMYERVRALLQAEDEIDAVEEMLPLAHDVLDAGESPARETA